jgi:hypothetical protein
VASQQPRWPRSVDAWKPSPTTSSPPLHAPISAPAGSATCVADAGRPAQVDRADGPAPRRGALPAAQGPGPASRPRYRNQPSSLKELATSAGQQACVELVWRRGSKELQRGRFLRLRVRPAGVTPRRLARAAGGELPARWLLAEWPHGELAPTKYWLANLPEATPLVGLVRLARSRWRVEQDYRELKGALGAGPLRRPRLGGLAPPRHAGLGRARLPHPGAATTPKTGGVGLTLWQLLAELQVLLACWAGACPVCKRPAPRWLRRTGRPLHRPDRVLLEDIPEPDCFAGSEGLVPIPSGVDLGKH